MEKFSLLELNEYIRRVIALNFQDSVWITAEISQIGISKGHRYIELLQRDSRNKVTLAQAKAQLWYRTYLSIKKRISIDMDSLLEIGTEVLIRVKIEFHEKYGLSLVIEDIDPSFTLGKNALQKQITLEKLEKSGALMRNNKCNLPLAFKKIAVISSSTAAGYKDFIHQLKDNAYGYTVQHTLYSVKVQGQYAVSEMLNAMEQIMGTADDYEAIIVIRGGGSKLDLAAFDDYTLCEAFSRSTLPIIAGIGHEIDTSILDLVAHTNVKTPTAAAEFVINHNLFFESRVNETAQNIVRNVLDKLNQQSLKINNLEYQIERQIKTKINMQQAYIDNFSETLKYKVKNIYKHYENLLNTSEQKALWSDPKMILKRGYSVSTIKGKLIKNITNISANDILETQFSEGSIKSKIIK